MKTIRFTIINPGSEAARAGIQQGDILLTYDGKQVADEASLQAAMQSASGTVVATVLRDNEALRISLQAGPLGVFVGEAEVPRRVVREVLNPQVDTTLSLPEAFEPLDVVITTAPSIEGKTVIKTFDIVSAEYVMGVNLFGDIMSAVRDVVGGRSKAVQQNMRAAREGAINDLRESAFELGANAVIATRIEYNEFSGGGKSMVMLAAYGTAVFVG